MLDAVAFALILAASPAADPRQTIVGPTFERLLHGVETQCPTSQARFTSPAALLDTEDAFAEQLPRRDFLRLRNDTPPAPDGRAACAQRDGGATCPALATLSGIQTARLEPRFVRFACARGDKPW